MSRALLDVNVLIALADEQHVHHAAAHAWWSKNQAAGWASCPLTQNGFLRVLCQPRYPNPLSLVDAHELLRGQTAGTDHEFWPDDLSLLDGERFDRDRILGPKQLTDLYLLAIAVRRGGRLATFDAALPLGAVRGAKQSHLARVGEG